VLSVPVTCCAAVVLLLCPWVCLAATGLRTGPRRSCLSSARATCPRPSSCPLASQVRAPAPAPAPCAGVSACAQTSMAWPVGRRALCAPSVVPPSRQHPRRRKRCRQRNFFMGTLAWCLRGVGDNALDGGRGFPAVTRDVWRPHPPPLCRRSRGRVDLRGREHGVWSRGVNSHPRLRLRHPGPLLRRLRCGKVLSDGPLGCPYLLPQLPPCCPLSPFVFFIQLFSRNAC
jgi:hypothetical protein